MASACERDPASGEVPAAERPLNFPQCADARAMRSLPEGIPEAALPEEALNEAHHVELGRLLFFDRRLSGNRTQSCGDCHQPERAFTDGLAQALGSTGEQHPRGAMSLINVAYARSLNWASTLHPTLETQAPVPILSDNPVEMGLQQPARRLEELSTDPAYARLLAEEPLDLALVSAALSAFQRTLIAFDAPVDRFERGERSALNDAQKLGYELFFSERFECFHCHGGFNYSDSVLHGQSPSSVPQFHNNGLYNLDGEGAYPASDQGLFEQTRRPEDRGKFKAPTLRNIALTAPYMHDGSAEDLGSVLDHYARGGRLTEVGESAGDGSLSPLKSNLLLGFRMRADEREAMLAFFEALTDNSPGEDPCNQDPWPTLNEASDAP